MAAFVAPASAAASEAGTPAAPGTTDASTADPAVWGVYAHMVGRRWSSTSSQGKPMIDEFTWLEPGRRMLHHQFDAKTGKTWQRVELTPSQQPGELVAQMKAFFASSQRTVRVRADGSALRAAGMADLPMLTRLTDDGGWTEQFVEVDSAGVVTRVRYEYVRRPLDAPASGVQSARIAEAEKSPAPVPPPPVQTNAGVAVATPQATPAAAVPAPAVPTRAQAGRLAATEALLGKLDGRTFLHEKEEWVGDTLIIGWGTYRWDEARGEFTAIGGSLGNAATYPVVYRRDEARGIYVGSGTIAGDEYEYELVAVSADTLATETFKRNWRGKRSSAGNGTWNLSSDGRMVTTFKALWMTMTYTMVPVADGEIERLGPIVRERQAQGIAARAREKQERSDARWNTFNAIVSGVAQAAQDVHQEQQAQAASTAALNQSIAEIARRAEPPRSVSPPTAPADTQQAGRDALARQLADGVAYRNAQAAKATTPAERDRWIAENEKAMQEASRLGLAAQVNGEVARASAGASASAAASRPVDPVRAQPDMQRQAGAAAQAERERAAAEQRATAQRLQAEEADRARKAEAQRLAEQQARQRAEAARQHALQSARTRLALRADTCIGGSGRYYVIGPRADVPGCVNLQYEARCPGVPAGQGVQGSQSNYVGGSCMGVGDAIAIPASPLSCPAKQVLVTVLGVTDC